MHYLKFTAFHALSLLAVVSVLLGGVAIVWGFATMVGVIVLGDLLLGNDTSTPEVRYPWVHDTLLLSSLPLMILLFLVNVWSVSATDWLGVGAAVGQWLNTDLLQARSQTELWQRGIQVAYIGLVVSTLGTVTGHELVHRVGRPIQLCVGRWLLAFSFDANFSIEHVHGHHRFVATPQDPASAPRGRNVYQHILHSTLYGNISAWRIEANRLKRRHRPVFSLHNVCLRGYAMSVALLVTAYGLAGPAGLTLTLACGVWAKAMLEIVNYMEHYGLCRAPGKRVEPRHSWNTNCKMSSWALFNLSRHSHHHAQAQVPYYKLKPMPQAPDMVSGYLATMFITLIPPLWHRLMAPKLARWDAQFATDEEKALLNKRLQDA